MPTIVRTGLVAGALTLGLSGLAAANFNDLKHCLQSEDLDRVIQACSAVIKRGLGPLDEEYLMRGAAYQKKGDHAKAFVDYAQAIKKMSESAIPYCYRAELYVERGDYARARADVRRGLELEPKKHYCMLREARTLFRIKQNDRALAAFTALIERFPDADDKPDFHWDLKPLWRTCKLRRENSHGVADYHFARRNRQLACHRNSGKCAPTRALVYRASSPPTAGF